MTDVPLPSRDRLTELFLEFTRIASPFKHERHMADAVISRWEAVGLAVQEDDRLEDRGRRW
jgi:hypothetical protein